MPRVVDHDERRDQILGATRRIILRGGFERATMREIAAEAGFAHGALHRYFPNKQSLLVAAFVGVYTATNKSAEQALAGKRGLDALRVLCLHILPLGSDGAKAARIVVAFWDYAIQQPELWRTNKANLLRWRNQMRQYLDEARQDGEIDSALANDLIVDQITTMNTGFLVMSNLMTEMCTDERQIAALDAVLDGLRATKRSV